MTLHSITRRRVLPASLLTAALVAVGCKTDTLNITNPDVLNVADYNSTVGATPLRNGVVQDFAVVFSGTQDGFVMSTGNMADEIQATDTFDDRLFPNQRNMTTTLPTMDTYYLNMHRARAGTTRAIAVWTQFKPAQKDTISELYAIRGYVENMFAEGYCAGVPFSEENGVTTTYGKPQTTAEILNRSVASFDTALANAQGASYKNLSAIGRARALLNLGQYAAAAAAVAGVPTSYTYKVYHSSATTRQENGIWRGTTVSGSRYMVGTQEGTNGLPFLQSPADPRVLWTPSTRTGFDGTSKNMPTQLKYTQTSSVTLADGIEARLIELEARLQGGAQADRDAVFAGLNVLRATGLATTITPIATAPTTQDAAVDLLFRERGYWLWLTGHRLGDLRRMIRQYGRSANAVFPTGPVVTRPTGTVYGNDVNFPVPFDETNNPNFTGCIDRKA
jgi:hypothetical protein